MIDFDRLADIRKDRDITQEMMANILKVNRSTYAMWETTDNLIPFNYLYEYAKYFNISIDYVLGLDYNREKITYDDFDLIRLGKNLKKLRLKNGLSQSELAKKLNVTKMCISKYESGSICISTSNIIKYHQIFNISINELCGVN